MSEVGQVALASDAKRPTSGPESQQPPDLVAAAAADALRESGEQRNSGGKGLEGRGSSGASSGSDERIGKVATGSDDTQPPGEGGGEGSRSSSSSSEGNAKSSAESDHEAGSGSSSGSPRGSQEERVTSLGEDRGGDTPPVVGGGSLHGSQEEKEAPRVLHPKERPPVVTAEDGSEEGSKILHPKAAPPKAAASSVATAKTEDPEVEGPVSPEAGKQTVADTRKQPGIREGGAKVVRSVAKVADSKAKKADAEPTKVVAAKAKKAKAADAKKAEDAEAKKAKDAKEGSDGAGRSKADSESKKKVSSEEATGESKTKPKKGCSGATGTESATGEATGTKPTGKDSHTGKTAGAAEKGLKAAAKKWARPRNIVIAVGAASIAFLSLLGLRALIKKMRAAKVR